jgi:fimbrial chaperone protein
MQSTLFQSNLRNLAKIISFFCFILCAQLSYAGYQFDKTSLEVSLKRSIDTIKFSNSNKDIPLSLQMRMVRWTQNNGNDVYQQTKDLIIAPPQVRIPPSQSQLVRVGWRSPQPISQELAYRMIVTDLTPYKQNPNTIIVRLQLNLPIFIEPENIDFKAQWQIKKVSSNALKILITNTGNIHIRVSKFTITNQNEEVIGSQPTLFYLLPGQSKQGTLSLTKTSGQIINVIADTNKGKLRTTVNI